MRCRSHTLIPVTDPTPELEERRSSALEAVLRAYAPVIEFCSVEVRRPTEDDFNIASPQMFPEVMVSVEYRTSVAGDHLGKIQFEDPVQCLQPSGDGTAGWRAGFATG